MLGALRTRWHNVREGFWFYPGLTVLGLMLLALVAIRIDRGAQYDRHLFVVFGGDASAAREILSAIASSFVTVAGVTLSMTIVTLQLVAGQYSPRAVRGFLSDRVNQLTAGGFVGVVAYCLLVLRVVRTESGAAPEFVPRLAVSIGIGLALLALGLLVYFVHHIAMSVRVSNMAAEITRETLALLKDPYPGSSGERADPDSPFFEEGAETARLYPRRPGYVQSIALDEIVAHLPEGSRLELRLGPGDFVTETESIALVAPPPDDKELVRKLIHRAVFVTSERTLAQDAAFGVQQLTDIALRGLSPGINDPTTALTCIGYIGACLERLGAADPARLQRIDTERDVRIRVRARTFEQYVEESIVEIGRFTAGNARVVVALLERIACVHSALNSEASSERGRVLRAATVAVVKVALEDVRTEHDRELIVHYAEGLVPDELLQQQV